MKDFPDEIKKCTIHWDCIFQKKKSIESDEARPFFEEILPKLRHFKRLVPREAMFGGIRQVYCHKWIQSENPNDELHFLDINSAHTFVCSNYLFPYGKCTIMIGDALNDVHFKNKSLISVSTGKEMCGLVKAKILPSQKCEPFFPTKIFTEHKKKSDRQQKLCSECGLIIYGSGSKKLLIKAQKAHICNFCFACEKKHDPDPDCQLKVAKIFTKEKKSGVFQAMCAKCLENRSHEPCQHQEHDREMEITTTVDTLNYALTNGHCTLLQIFEIWVRKEK